MPYVGIWSGQPISVATSTQLIKNRCRHQQAFWNSHRPIHHRWCTMEAATTPNGTPHLPRQHQNNMEGFNGAHGDLRRHYTVVSSAASSVWSIGIPDTSGSTQLIFHSSKSSNQPMELNPLFSYTFDPICHVLLQSFCQRRRPFVQRHIHNSGTRLIISSTGARGSFTPPSILPHDIAPTLWRIYSRCKRSARQQQIKLGYKIDC